jgi:hypothetical protein
MTSDEARNAVVLDDVISALEESRSPAPHRTTGTIWSSRFGSFAARHLVVLHAGTIKRSAHEMITARVANHFVCAIPLTPSAV